MIYITDKKEFDLRLWLGKDARGSPFWQGYPGILLDYWNEASITLVDMTSKKRFPSDLDRVMYFVFVFIPEYVNRFKNSPRVIGKASKLKYFFDPKIKNEIGRLEMEHEKLFPEYLNKGAKNPAAVAFLQALLVFGCYNPAIIIDGEYGEETAIGVKSLQRELGVDADGNFGPKTRAALFAKTKLDINSLQKDIFVEKTAKSKNIDGKSLMDMDN